LKKRMRECRFELKDELQKILERKNDKS